MAMNEFAKLTSQVMRLKTPSKPTKAFHKKAANLYDKYSRYFSGKTHKEIRKKYIYHLKRSK